MRFGIAIDLHARASAAADVGWPVVRDLAVAAEQAGLDLLVLPDHLSYRPGDGTDGYSVPDEPVGVRESMTVAAAVAVATDSIRIGHSVVNAPYRTPAMLAHLATTIADISDGRYSLGIGAGNSYDYDQLGVAADHRVARFEECVGALADLLRNGSTDLHGTYWAADRAELALRPADDLRPKVVVAAGGPRTMGVAARHGDAWNGWLPTDPDDTTTTSLLSLLERTCEEIGRDPSTIGRTADLAVDPLDLRGARSRSIATLERLRELGVDEVRCYALCEPTPDDRRVALDAFAAMVDDLR